VCHRIGGTVRLPRRLSLFRPFINLGLNKVGEQTDAAPCSLEDDLGERLWQLQVNRNGPNDIKNISHAVEDGKRDEDCREVRLVVITGAKMGAANKETNYVEDVADNRECKVRLHIPASSLQVA